MSATRETVSIGSEDESDPDIRTFVVDEDGHTIPINRRNVIDVCTRGTGRIGAGPTANLVDRIDVTSRTDIPNQRVTETILAGFHVFKAWLDDIEDDA